MGFHLSWSDVAVCEMSGLLYRDMEEVAGLGGTCGLGQREAEPWRTQRRSQCCIKKTGSVLFRNPCLSWMPTSG